MIIELKDEDEMEPVLNKLRKVIVKVTDRVEL
jgi:hypothetical protein